MGIDVSLRPRDFSLQFPLHGTDPPPSTTRTHATVRRQVVSLLAPACGRMRTTFKDGGEVCSGLGAIQYLSLPITIFLGMWLVRSKAYPPLPHTADLSSFTKQTGYHKYH